MTLLGTVTIVAKPTHAQLRLPAPAQVSSAQFVPGGNPTAVPNFRQIDIYQRYGVRPQVHSFVDSQTKERVIICEQGINIIVQGLIPPNGQSPSLTVSDKIDILADRIVIWTTDEAINPLVPSRSTQQEEAPLEFYLEGNIVFREGNREIRARSMYYNVRSRSGTILDAEALTPASPFYEGKVRLKADVIQQVDSNNFQAFGASITSSRLGMPQYWLQSEIISFRHDQQPRIDPRTGQLAQDHGEGIDYDNGALAVSRNNFLYLFGVPVFYWPTIATNLSDPFYYINSVDIGSDSVFGTQIRTEFNLYQLLGIDEPLVGTEWDLSLDYLSERGFGYGTTFDYDRRPAALGEPEAARGFLDAWAIHDGGFDNLGRGRRSLAPENDYRGRVRAQHRQDFLAGFRLSGEVGLISDRNFLEQYYEREWDEKKDQITGLELKRLADNRSLNFAANVRLNDFFTQTEGPRIDHFLLGGSFLRDRLTWFQHTHIGYPRLETARPSTDPNDADVPLPWETVGGVRYDSREGARLATRHELDFPLQLGVVKLVPFVGGEVAYWDQDRFGENVTRLLGQAGMRTSLPMSKIDPTVCSELLNLNGLAHKIIFESELLVANADQDLEMFPLYDPIQDDSIEAFQRRFILLDFAGTLPTRYDGRFYALRSGTQRWVSSPTTEIADDLTTLRSGVRQRWQTKRGLPGQLQVVDWITLDVHGTLFPQSNRDNFGEHVGLVDYDFRWHVGDRVTLLSDGFADFFGGGLHKVTLGGLITRPGRGSLFVGVRSLGGPIDSKLLSASVNYRMSHKWVATAGAALDLGDAGNIGQKVQFMRVGESFLVGIGVNVDVSRANVGAHLTIEPRILARSRAARVGGVPIPPVGTKGLE